MMRIAFLFHVSHEALQLKSAGKHYGNEARTASIHSMSKEPQIHAHRASLGTYFPIVCEFFRSET
jgi:hypothetical protein